VTGSGAAQSLRPVCVARRERLLDFGLMASTSAVPPREPSRRRRRLAARKRVSRRAHPASRTPGVDATSECRGTPEVEEKQEGPDPSRTPGLWNSESGWRVDQTRRPPGWERSLDTRCAYACSIARAPAGSGPSQANARAPARAWALRRAFRLFTMGSWGRFRFEDRARACVSGGHLVQRIVASSSDRPQCK